MKIRETLFCVLCIAGCLVSPVVSQIIPVDQALRPLRWDGSNSVMFLGAGLLQKSDPPIRAYANGIQRGPDLDIFKDFPGLSDLIVDDVTAGPNGSTLAAVVLRFSEKSVRHVILTYDSDGALKEIWDTEPYYHLAIVADPNGNVFALGNRLDDDPTKPSYPLLIEYDHSGNILHEGLQSLVFPMGATGINESGRIRGPSLLLRGQHIIVYAPEANDILVCGVDGMIKSRVNVSDVLERIKKQDKTKRLVLEDVFLVDDNTVILDINEHDKAEELKSNQSVDPSSIHPVLYSLDIPTGTFRPVLRTPSRNWKIAGVKTGTISMFSLQGSRASLKSVTF